MDLPDDSGSPRRDDGRLGMNEPISRRDFVNGTLLAGAGMFLSGHAPFEVSPADEWNGYGGVGDYRLSNGNTYDVMSAAHAMRDGAFEKSTASDTGETYDLTGKVVPGTVERTDERLAFHIEDRDGSESLPVTYTGTVPDPFRDGREVIVTGKLEEGTFVAEHDSLITKCPSKFQEEAEADPEHVIIQE